MRDATDMEHDTEEGSGGVDTDRGGGGGGGGLEGISWTPKKSLGEIRLKQKDKEGGGGFE